MGYRYGHLNERGGTGRQMAELAHAAEAPNGAVSRRVLRVVRRASRVSTERSRAMYVFVQGQRIGCCLAPRKAEGRAYLFMVAAAHVERLGR